MAKNDENKTQTTPETQTTAETIAAAANKTAKVKVPRGNIKDDPKQYVAVNGKSYLLPKGKESEVPQFIKDEFERSERAKERYFETREARINKDDFGLK